jgi:hypothetical protein
MTFLRRRDKRDLKLRVVTVSEETTAVDDYLAQLSADYGELAQHQQVATPPNSNRLERDLRS